MVEYHPRAHAVATVHTPVRDQESRRAWPLIPLLLALLALVDLREEFLLLTDHFTITSLVFLVRVHPLAVAVLILFPSLWKRYR